MAKKPVRDWLDDPDAYTSARKKQTAWTVGGLVVLLLVSMALSMALGSADANENFVAEFGRGVVEKNPPKSPQEYFARVILGWYKTGPDDDAGYPGWSKNAKRNKWRNGRLPDHMIPQYLKDWAAEKEKAEEEAAKKKEAEKAGVAAKK